MPLGELDHPRSGGPGLVEVGRVRVAASTAALSLALALAMTGTALAAAPPAHPGPPSSRPGFVADAHREPVPTTPAVSP